jgi:hypothetical protein
MEKLWSLKALILMEKEPQALEKILMALLPTRSQFWLDEKIDLFMSHLNGNDLGDHWDVSSREVLYLTSGEEVENHPSTAIAFGLVRNGVIKSRINTDTLVVPEETLGKKMDILVESLVLHFGEEKAKEVLMEWGSQDNLDPWLSDYFYSKILKNYPFKK